MEWSTVVRERFDCQHASYSPLSSSIFLQQQQSCEIPRFSSRYPSSPLSARSTSAELLGGGKEKGRFRIFDICAVAFLEMGGEGVEFSAFARGRMRCRARPIHSFVPSNLYPSSILPIHRLSSAPPTHPTHTIDFLHARLLPHFSPPTPISPYPRKINQATYIPRKTPQPLLYLGTGQSNLIKKIKK